MGLVLLGHPVAFWLGLIVTGIATGGLYALFSSGLSMIFGAAQIMNFAQGDIFMAGGYAAVFFMSVLHLSYWLALPLATLALGVAGIVASQTLFRRIGRGQRSLEMGIVMTVGLSIVLEAGALQLLGGTVRIPDTWLAQSRFTVGGVTIQSISGVALILAVAVLAALGAFLRYTKVGLAIRAFPQDRQLAVVLGLPEGYVRGCAIGIGCALSGLAGATVAPYYGVYPTMGSTFIFVGLAVLFMGGLTSVLGTVVAALIVGVATSLLAGGVSATAAAIAPLAVLAVVLMVRPEGLLGARVRHV
jgi:branched-chain amino acid transport system permease protein